jgi:hypothetical protein
MNTDFKVNAVTFARGSRRVLVSSFLLCVIALSLLHTSPYARPSLDSPKSVLRFSPPRPPLQPNARRSQELLQNLPLNFEVNAGQYDPAVRFSARGDGYRIFLNDDGPSFVFRAGADGPQQTISMRFPGPGLPRVVGLDRLPGITNYFIGRDRSGWKTGIANYARVKYEQAHPGIDIVYYGHGHDLEYDLVAQPGTDQPTFRFLLSGIGRPEDARIEETGDLILRVHGASLRLHRPVAYQQGPGDERQKVDAHYSLLKLAQSTAKNHELDVSIEVGNFDRSRTLVIDPVVTFSTFLGGTAPDFGLAIAVDSAGNSYVAGWTDSTDFPTVTPFQGSDHAAPYSNAFITNINAAGTAILYSTYLGGSGGESASGVAVDSIGNAYLIGGTSSSDFPVTPGAFNANCGPCPSIFITKLNSTGSQLVYSTYFGGTTSVGGDSAVGIAVDSSGSAYVTGSSHTPNFPTTPGAFQTTGQGVFVSKLNSTGSALSYSTLIGPGYGTGIVVTPAGNVYVAGGATGSAYPVTPGAFQTAYRTGGGTSTTGFVTELNSSGSALVYSTFLGGSDLDIVTGIGIDGSGNASVAGQTFSKDFPVANAFQPTLNGAANAFVSKLNSNGSALVYSTYLGGSADEFANGIAVDSTGNAYITGFASSTDFPLVGALQHTYGGGNSDAFLTVMDPNGNPSFSTFLGGSGGDQGNGIAVDSSGNAYLAGTTQSGNFPGINALQPGLASSPNYTCSNGPCEDAFVTKFAVSEATPSPDFALASLTPSQSITAGGTATYNVAVTPVGGFTQQISLGCSSLPPSSTCTLPMSWSSNGLSTLNATVTVATTAHSSAVMRIPDVLDPFGPSWGALVVLVIAMCAMCLPRLLDRNALGRSARFAAATSMLLLLLLPACGGGSGGGGGGSSGGTPSGTYTIKITGNSGNIDHTLNLTLTVN